MASPGISREIHGSIFNSTELKVALGEAFYRLITENWHKLSDGKDGDLDRAAYFYGLFRPEPNSALPVMSVTLDDVGHALDFLNKINYQANS